MLCSAVQMSTAHDLTKLCCHGDRSRGAVHLKIQTPAFTTPSRGSAASVEQSAVIYGLNRNIPQPPNVFRTSKHRNMKKLHSEPKVSCGNVIKVCVWNKSPWWLWWEQRHWVVMSSAVVWRATAVVAGLSGLRKQRPCWPLEGLDRQDTDRWHSRFRWSIRYTGEARHLDAGCLWNSELEVKPSTWQHSYLALCCWGNTNGW